jgi:hypothetical protein
VLYAYAYAGDSPVMYSDPMGLKPCLVERINPVADYVPAGVPPGRMVYGCQYIGDCGDFLGGYLDSTVPLGCKCKDYCLINVDKEGNPIGPSICFNTPPWWTLVPSPPILFGGFH